jgi:hypothetical protein
MRGLLHSARLTWRAVPASVALGIAVLPMIFIAFAYFILLHNPDLERATASRTIRVSGSLAIGFFAANFANAVLRARPAWPWMRSLPWSSTERVIVDAFAIGLPLIPFAIALVPLDIIQASIVALTAPAVAACGASALRKGANRQSGAAGESMLFGFFALLAIAVWPITSVLIFASTPLFIALGARRDRRGRVTRFFELQHDATGDPMWVGR